MLLVLNIQPYHKRVFHYSKIDISFYCFLTLLFVCISARNVASVKSHYFVRGLTFVVLIVAIIPLVYISCLCIYWLFSSRKWGITLINRIHTWRRGYDDLEDSLPDRILNPRNYQVLENAAIDSN